MAQTREAEKVLLLGKRRVSGILGSRLSIKASHVRRSMQEGRKGVSARNGRLGKVTGADVGPSYAGGPGRPQAHAERGAIGQAGPPLAGFQRSAGDVREAVPIEIADLNIDPSHARGPGGP